MTRQAEYIMETLFTLAQEPTCKPIFICGVPGSGKRALCQSLANVSSFGITHVPLRLWHTTSSHERMSAWAQAKAEGDMEGAAYLAGYPNIVDWARFYSDMDILLNTGRVEVTDIYDEATCSRIRSRYVTLPKDPPHLLLVSGSCLMHRPVIDMARLVLFLDVSNSILMESGAFGDIPAYRLSPEHRLDRWAGAYCLRFQRQAIIVTQATQRAMHGIALRM